MVGALEDGEFAGGLGGGRRLGVWAAAGGCPGGLGGGGVGRRWWRVVSSVFPPVSAPRLSPVALLGASGSGPTAWAI